MMKNKVEIVKEIVASLYSNNAQFQRNVLYIYYADNAHFQDPLISLSGLSAIRAQFKTLALCINNIYIESCHAYPSAAATMLLESSVPPGSRMYAKRDAVLVDSVVGWVLMPGWWTFRMRVLSRFEFEPNGLICYHEDIWPLRDLISNAWFIGPVYNFGTWLLGLISTWIIQCFLVIHDWLHERAAKTASE